MVFSFAPILATRTYNPPMNEPQIKPDWKDFVALVIAAYQVLLVPLLAIIGVGILVVVGLSWLAR
jgi:hypothetical protein